MDKILVEYNGEYPCLCMGELKVTINNICYIFPSFSLTSGGSAGFNEDYSEEYVTEGPWSIDEWPEDFPEEYKEATLEEINNVIPHGCCGGCL